METCWELLLLKSEAEFDVAREASVKAKNSLNSAKESLEKINSLLLGYLSDLKILEQRSHTIPEATFIRQAVLQLQNVQVQAEDTLKRAERDLYNHETEETRLFHECKKYEKLIARDNERKKGMQARKDQSELDAIGLQQYISRSRRKIVEVY